MTYEDYLLTTKHTTRIRSTRIMKRLVKRFQKHVALRSTVDAPYCVSNPDWLKTHSLSLFHKLLFDQPDHNPTSTTIVIGKVRSYIWHNIIGEPEAVKNYLHAIFTWALEKTKE